MRRICLLAMVVWGCCWPAAAQNPSKGFEPVDYSAIERVVGDPSSPYYYPDLMRRYEKGDTTLTAADYRMLYYGFPSRPNYRPLLPDRYADSIATVFSGRESIEAEGYQKIIHWARLALQDNPFGMRNLNLLAFVHQTLGEEDLAVRQMRKLKGVLGAIQSSGDGLSEQTPWYVTHMDDAEDVLNLLVLKFGRMIVLSREVVYVPVTGELAAKGYYFNYAEIYKRRPDYLDATKQPRKLEISPVPSSSRYY